MENIPKKYCQSCGREMLHKIVLDHYDRNTGAKLEKIVYFCPVIDGADFPTMEGTYLGHWIYV